MIKAIPFDLDDTLDDRRSSIINYSERFIKRYCGELADTEL